MQNEYPSAVTIADELIDNYPDLFKNDTKTKIVLIDALGQYYSEMTAYMAGKEKRLLDGIGTNTNAIFDTIASITSDYAKSLSKSSKINQ